MVAGDMPSTLCQLPEGAIPLEVVEVCGYLTAEGRRKWTVRYRADVPVSTTLGLLALAKHQILSEMDTWPADDGSG